MKTSMLSIPPSILMWMLIAATVTSLPAEILTIGSPAPSLEVECFLKGGFVEKLSKGTVYVIEFSATTCAPCLKALAHLEELQKKHPQVIFISTYTQGAGDTKEGVLSFLDKHGDPVGIHVAMDHEGAMWKNWQKKAGLDGVPWAYLVDAEGHIAWIGSPEDLDEPLDNLLVGKTGNLRRDRMVLYFEQAQCAANTESALRRKRFNEAAAAQHEHLMQRQWAEVIRLGEEEARAFPENEFYFLWHKLYALSHNPQTTDQALKFAAELSARMPYSFDESYGQHGSLGQEAEDPNVQIARFLVDGEANDDALLSDAATILLGKAEDALIRIKDQKRREEAEDYIRWIASMTAAKKRDYVRASVLVRESINWLRSQKNPGTNDESRKIWAAKQRETLDIRQSSLASYEKEIERRAGKP